jgi:hypothetical protein
VTGRAGPITLAEASLHRLGGPAFGLVATIDRPTEGTYVIQFVPTEGEPSCARVEVARRAKPPPTTAASTGAWPSTNAWGPTFEHLYSLWIEHLFDAPAKEALEFRPLHLATRQGARNFLYDYLGLGEDEASRHPPLVLDPDCADLPYFLRAYFAWKLSLPFAFRACGRGQGHTPPRCGPILTSDSAGEPDQPLPDGRVARFAALLRQVRNAVHSGSARTALADDATDAYPVVLTRDALRPGVLYADPYGHVMVIAKWVAQDQHESGLLLAVDGQPDGTVGRKRFWEGTFLFAHEPGAGPGFKAFRPIAHAIGGLRALGNRELGRSPARFSLDQATIDPPGFYARMAALIHPLGLAAEQAYDETLAALVEQLGVRVGSVEHGAEYLRAHPGVVIPMPDGPHIFEASGPWEDYSTPSRDFRLLIAMRVLAELPDRIVAHPELFLLGERSKEAVAGEIRARHQRALAAERITYHRSDGTPFQLSLGDLYLRKAAFEMTYNPNDCVEARWGASEDSAEYSPCQRRAPTDQRAKMSRYRSWFAQGRRPAR